MRLFKADLLCEWNEKIIVLFTKNLYTFQPIVWPDCVSRWSLFVDHLFYRGENMFIQYGQFLHCSFYPFIGVTLCISVFLLTTVLTLLWSL